MTTEQDVDRSEAATPFKLQKAREQGQTPRSTDATSAAVFLVSMLYIASQGMSAADSFLRLMRAALLRAATANEAALWLLMQQLAREATGILWPLLFALPLAAVIASVAQTGSVLSATPLQMDFTRLNPATGLKRIFSQRTLFDGARSCLKLLLLSAAALIALGALLPQFHAITALPPAAFLSTLVQDVTGLGLKMGVVLAALACVDMLYTRREFSRRMRMSRRELKDEFKNREGDPRVRARLRELRREMLRRSLALKNTGSADVVLTNPTHYAVALRYVHGEMEAPRVVAKGAGKLAAAMRAIAARHGVIVVQNPPLARRLFRDGAIDEYIPASLHAEVARIIVWVMAVRRRHAPQPQGANA